MHGQAAIASLRSAEAFVSRLKSRHAAGTETAVSAFRFLLDRTAILFLGVAAGVAIGYAFGTGGQRKEAVVLAPEAAPIQGAKPSAIPPPPNGPAAPEGPTPEADKSPAPPAEPIVDDTTKLADTVKPGSVRIGVFGDSFGDGVYSALYRLLPGAAGYQVVKFSQPSTGFTRYKRLNLEQHDEQQIAAQPIDIAVISFGANDAQGVCDGAHCGALMSPFWQRVITTRVESYVAMLRRHGAVVYWVGLPVMRDTAFDSDSSAMNAFYKALMARLGVPFVDIRPLTVDAQGRYEAYYQDDTGAQKLFRANDGVHMSMNGYIRITWALAQRIKASVAETRATKPAAPPSPVPAPGNDADTEGNSPQ